jgi:hypothetical protein
MRDRDDAISRELEALRPRLDEFRVEEPPLALVERTLRRAGAELARRPALAAGVDGSASLPAGFYRELARLVAASLPPLALVLATTVFVVGAGASWLASWLPAPLVAALTAAYALGTLGWLAVVYGALPLAAHHRARLQLREVSS